MAKLINTRFTVNVLKASAYQLNGTTTFVCYVELTVPACGLESDGTYTISISSSYGLSRKLMAEMALVEKGDAVVFELSGYVDSGGFLEVEKLFFVKNLTQAEM